MDYLTVEEAAARMGVSAATTRRWCMTGKLAASKVGKQWLIEESALPATPVKVPNVGAPSTKPNFGRALKHVRSLDLVEEWVPDVLRHKDQLASGDELLKEVADRFDRGVIDPAIEVEIPKTPFFSRTAHLLSLHDRAAYQATIETFAFQADASLSRRVYSARIGPRKSRYFTAKGVDQWRRWKWRVRLALFGPYEWLIKTDLTAYFDCIKHDQLASEVAALGVSSEIVDRLMTMLKSWSSVPGQGLIQGPDASRILGNIYLIPVDNAMIDAGYNYWRYMDDIRIVSVSKAEAIRAMRLLEKECKRRGLIASPAKTELLHGEAALTADDDEREHVAYLFDSGQLRAARPILKRMLRKSILSDGHINVRQAKFSLWRLSLMRENTFIQLVTKRLDDLSPVASVVGNYLGAFISRKATIDGINSYIADKERVSSPFLLTFIFAAMLEHPGHLPPEWVAFARVTTKDRNEPKYLRVIASNVLARGRTPYDLDWLRSELRNEYDPFLRRGYATALARVREFDSSSAETLRLHSPFLRRTANYLLAATHLPSLVRSKGNVSI